MVWPEALQHKNRSHHTGSGGHCTCLAIFQEMPSTWRRPNRIYGFSISNTSLVHDEVPPTKERKRPSSLKRALAARELSREAIAYLAHPDAERCTRSRETQFGSSHRVNRVSQVRKVMVATPISLMTFALQRKDRVVREESVRTCPTLEHRGSRDRTRVMQQKMTRPFNQAVQPVEMTCCLLVFQVKQ